MQMCRLSTRRFRRTLTVLIAGLAVWSGTLQDPEQSFFLFESGHVRPLALSPGDDLLVAVNTPDNRLQVFSLPGNLPLPIGEVLDSDGVLNGDETPRRAPPVKGWQRRR